MIPAYHYKQNMQGAKSAGVKTGDELEIICEGADEQEALNAIVALFESGLE